MAFPRSSFQKECSTNWSIRRNSRSNPVKAFCKFLTFFLFPQSIFFSHTPQIVWPLPRLGWRLTNNSFVCWLFLFPTSYFSGKTTKWLHLLKGNETPMLHRCELIQCYSALSTELKTIVADWILVRIITYIGVMLSSLLINFAGPPTDKELWYDSL